MPSCATDRVQSALCTMRAALAVFVWLGVLMGCTAPSPNVTASNVPPLDSASAVLAGTASAAAAAVPGPSGSPPQSTALERCPETLGTLFIVEDTDAPWYYQLRNHQLGSTKPVLQRMIEQSNCFVIVERNRGMDNMLRERALTGSGELHAENKAAKAQMVSADYTMSPVIEFQHESIGMGALMGQLGGFGMAKGNIEHFKPSTILNLIDNRSGVQIAASEGTSKDSGSLPVSAFSAAMGDSMGAYSKTPQGKILTIAFVDSYNQMVNTLRHYKVQTAKAGLGTGGRLASMDNPSAAAVSEPLPSRFVNLDAPLAVHPQQSFAVQVWLSQQQATPEALIVPPPGQQLDAEGKLRLALPQDRNSWSIDVALTAPGFDFAGGTSNYARLTLTTGNESTPAMFNLVARAGQLGPRLLRATLWHEGSYLGSVSRKIDIASAEPKVGEKVPSSTSERPTRNLAFTLQEAPQQGSKDFIEQVNVAPPGASAEAPPPFPLDGPSSSRTALPTDATPLAADLTIYVRHDNPLELGRASVVLASPYLKGGVVTETMTYPSDAEAWLEGWTARFQRMPASPSSSDLERNVVSLRGFGHELYERLAPRYLKQTLAAIIEAAPSKTLTLQVYTNNPSIPWELMRPGVISGRDVDFLGTSFRMARWHVADGDHIRERPLQKLIVEEVVVIAPQYSGTQTLTAQNDEVSFLSHLPGFRRADGTFAGLRQLALRPPVGIVHFAGHGELTGTGPAQRRYMLKLEDARFGSVEWSGLARPRSSPPDLYFFNACELGIAESQAGAVAGWAPAVLDTGAGGYIGGLWSLRDTAASRFAMRFYSEIETTKAVTVSEAMRRARALFFETGDPTYLAYVFYGDVNLALVIR